MIDVSFKSVEDYLNTITKFDIYATQLSPGNFLCFQREVQLPKLIVGNRYISSSLQYHSILKLEYLYVSIPKDKSGLLLNGKEVKQNQPIVYTLNQEIFTRIPDCFDNFYLIVPVIELDKYLDEDNLERLNNITQQPVCRQIFVSSLETQTKIRELISFLIRSSNRLSYQAVLDTQEIIMELLCKLLTSESLPLEKTKVTQTRQLSIVKRSLNYIHKSANINISSRELSSISFCSLRSLEYAFKSVLNITPKQYLIKRRLQLIHSELKQERGKLISEIIEKFGIVNQGRFAHDYFTFYNEYPHQTRDRLKKV